MNNYAGVPAERSSQKLAQPVTKRGGGEGRIFDSNLIHDSPAVNIQVVLCLLSLCASVSSALG